MSKRIGYNKIELKQKFDKFYKEGKIWHFDVNDKLYLTKKKVIELYLNKSKIIVDLGCADGDFLCSILLSNDISDKKIIGVDISEYAIKKAKKKNCYDELYIGYIDDIELYTKKTKEFDLILLNEVLYYVDFYKKTLEKILFLKSKYIFISLAMGPGFFSDKEANKIEDLLEKFGYKQIYNMNYKFGIPIRYLETFYKILHKDKSIQTHKKIYMYEKITN